jgi:hypothetical protein
MEVSIRVKITTDTMIYSQKEKIEEQYLCNDKVM